MGKPLRVAFLVPYPWGCAPGQRFRFEQWLSLLPESALEAAVLPLLSKSTYGILYEHGRLGQKAVSTAWAGLKRTLTVLSLRRADVVFVYRELFPLGPPILEQVLERRLPVVFDFDDAIYLPSASRANERIIGLKRPEKTGEIVRGAAATIAGNATLAAYARQFSERVSIIPTTLDIERYRPHPRPTGQASRDRIRVGWSGSPTTSPHLSAIQPALRQALANLPIELMVVGDRDFGIPGARRVTVKPWNPTTEISDVQSLDIGLMPLPDDEWSRSKCGFKALLYMAVGVPVIASPVGVNTEIIEHGVNGLFATTDQQWVDALELLVKDADLRRRLGIAGRRTVVTRYSGQHWAGRFLDVLKMASDYGRSQ